jgi:hypothetical protein
MRVRGEERREFLLCRVTLDIDEPKELRKVVNRVKLLVERPYYLEFFKSSFKGFHLILFFEINPADVETLMLFLGDDPVRVSIDKRKDLSLFKQVLFSEKYKITGGKLSCGFRRLLFSGRFPNFIRYIEEEKYERLFKANPVKKPKIKNYVYNFLKYLDKKIG